MNITYIIPTVGRKSITNTINSILNEDKNARILIQRGSTAGKNRNSILSIELLSNQLDNIKSDFIAFIDDDDFYNEGYLSQIDNDFDIIVMRMNQGGLIIPSYSNELRKANVGINFIVKTEFLKKIIIKNNIIDDYFLFDEGHAEDWRFLEKLLRFNPKVKITDDVYYVCSQVNHKLPHHLQYKNE